MIFLILVCFIVQCYTNSFSQFKEQMENKVQWLSGNMSQIFQQRCNKEIIQCETKSINLCLGTGQRQCLQQFPTPFVCASPGIKFSLQSGIRLPNTVNLDDLTTRQRQFICSSTKLTQTFSQISDQNKNRHSYAYFGSSTGAFRVLPSFMQKQVDGLCYDYDPRRRPWYVSAISGGKNIILILDVSNSMDKHRLSNAKSAVKAIIDSMSVHDFVGFITFSDQANTLGGTNRIERISEEVKDKLKADIDNLEANGKTNYQIALQKAFQLLNSSITDEFGSPCSETVFLFMTDGQPTQGYETDTELINLIDSNINQINNKRPMELTFMSYAFGVGLQTDLLSSLSCYFSGMLFIIEESSNMLNKLSNYYVYLAEGAEMKEPIWSQPYIDAFGLGQITTVSMPVYYFDSNNVRTILGVAGIDVLMSQLLAYEFERPKVLQQLIKQQSCFASNLNQCQLQSVRFNQNQQVTCNFTCNITQKHLEDCPSEITNDLWKDPVNIEQDEDKCCSLTHEELKLTLGLVFGLAGGAIVVTIVACCCKKKFCSKSQKKNNQRLKKSDSSKNLEPQTQSNIMNSQYENDEEAYYEKARKAGLKIYPFEPFG